MFERFTERARKVVVSAQEEARRFNHNYIGTEHLLLGLLRKKEAVAAQTLNSLGVTLKDVRGQVESIVGHGEEGTSEQDPFTPRTKKVLELAIQEARRIEHNYVGTEHLLLGLLQLEEGVAARILRELLVNPEAIREEVRKRLGMGQSPYGPRMLTDTERHPRPFYRSRYERQIAGVCGGIAEYFGWDPKLVRVAMAGLIIATGGAGLAAYLLFWILLPIEPY